jgi:hypothetical protein
MCHIFFNLKRDIRHIRTYSKSTSVKTNKSEEMIQPKSKPKFKKQFKGECRQCGAKGHKAADYWDNDKNKSKCPSNYKKRTPDTSSSFQNPQNKNLKCDYCHIKGPTIERCYRKMNKARTESKYHHMVCMP